MITTRLGVLADGVGTADGAAEDGVPDGAAVGVDPPDEPAEQPASTGSTTRTDASTPRIPIAPPCQTGPAGRAGRTDGSDGAGQTERWRGIRTRRVAFSSACSSPARACVAASWVHSSLAISRSSWQRAVSGASAASTAASSGIG